MEMPKIMQDSGTYPRKRSAQPEPPTAVLGRVSPEYPAGVAPLDVHVIDRDATNEHIGLTETSAFGLHIQDMQGAVRGCFPITAALAPLRVRLLASSLVAPPAKQTSSAFVERCLSNLDTGAEQDGIEISPEVRAEAERILRRLGNLPHDTDVYALDDGKVAIEVLRNPGAIFLLHCEPEGGALCIVVLDGLARTLRYDVSSRQIPDCFVEQGLHEVLQHGGRR